MPIIDLNEIPNLLSKEVSNETPLFFESLDGQYYKITKGELFSIPLAVERLKLISRDGYISVRSPQANNGGFDVFMPPVPNQGGEEDRHANLMSFDVVFESEDAPTITDFPPNKQVFIWKKISTGEKWLCTVVNDTTIAKIQFT